MIAAMKAQNERKIAKIIDIINITLRNVTELADLAIVRPPVIMNAMPIHIPVPIWRPSPSSFRYIIAICNKNEEYRNYKYLVA